RRPVCRGRALWPAAHRDGRARVVPLPELGLRAVLGRGAIARGQCGGDRRGDARRADLRAHDAPDRPRRRRLDGAEEARGILLSMAPITTDATDLEVLAPSAPRDLLRFTTVGSVDDGKSTLIGRLLHDSQAIYDDHL